MKNISFKEVKKALGNQNFVRVIGSEDGFLAIEVHSLAAIDIDKLESLEIPHTWERRGGTNIFLLDPEKIEGLDFVI